VPPEVAKQLEPGTYELTATVKGITSEPVRFVVKQPRSKADEAEVASSLCSFHVKRGAYDEAIRVATAALSASLGNPDSFHSWLGEAYRGKGDFAKALEHYQKSLDLYKSLHPERYRQEPPQGLLLRIHEMQAKLQSQKGKSTR
jgi:tetratricopeptide (TPR) repeat protein